LAFAAIDDWDEPLGGWYNAMEDMDKDVQGVYQAQPHTIIRQISGDIWTCGGVSADN
jgi:hypothetical protein